MLIFLSHQMVDVSSAVGEWSDRGGYAYSHAYLHLRCDHTVLDTWLVSIQDRD